MRAAALALAVLLSLTPDTLAAPARKSSCDAACAHRKRCGVPGGGDVAGCVASCKAITPLLGPTDLSDYEQAECPRVQAMEPGFQVLARVAAACAHHTRCVPGSDTATCLATNVALASALPPDALDKAIGDYLGWSCEQVRADEPSYAAAGSCVRACRRAVACTRRGDVGGCALQCSAGVQQGKIKAADVAKVEKSDCAAIARMLPPPPPPRPAPASDRNGDGCRDSGNMDCPPFTVCCAIRGNHMSEPGEPGSCLSPAVCNMKPPRDR